MHFYALHATCVDPSRPCFRASFDSLSVDGELCKWVFMDGLFVPTAEEREFLDLHKLNDSKAGQGWAGTELIAGLRWFTSQNDFTVRKCHQLRQAHKSVYNLMPAMPCDTSQSWSPSLDFSIAHRAISVSFSSGVGEASQKHFWWSMLKSTIITCACKTVRESRVQGIYFSLGWPKQRRLFHRFSQPFALASYFTASWSK